jgi:hypothetical protein
MSRIISGAELRKQAVAITDHRPKDGAGWYTALALAVLGITAIIASVYLGPAENWAFF